MEPTGFRLLTQSVIFNSSHVKGGGEGSGGKVAVHGGVEVTGNHGMGTRFFRVLGNDELEPSSRRPPRGGDWGLPVFPLFVQLVVLSWMGPLPGPRTVKATRG